MTSKPPSVVPFSQIGEPPEPSFTWWKPFGILYAGSMTIVTAVVLILALPIITILTIIRRIIYGRLKKVHTDPSQIKIAIIGGGWSGIQCMARLKELGVDLENNVKGFEAHDGFGGTWHPNLRYHSIQIHGAMWITSFANYQYDPKDRDRNDGKVGGEEIKRYINRYARDVKNLHASYEFNTKVTKVKYDSKKRKATLILQTNSDTSSTKSVHQQQPQQRESEPFDLVIYCSQASHPKIPDIPHPESFGGEIIHTTQFKEDNLHDIVSNNKKVVVLGGSKAGADMALCLHREGHQNFEWVMRKPYLFWKYECAFHNRSVVSALRGASTIAAAVWAPFSATLSGLILWGSGMFVTYGEEPVHFDWNRFHFGILCPTQRQDLASIPKVKKIIGSPLRYVRDGFEVDVKNRRKEVKLCADVILLGTGCESGIDRLEFEKDGKHYNLNQNEQLLNHFLYPDFPVFANSTALWTTFGPVRAVNSADLAVYHCCIQKPLGEEDMKRMASWQMGDALNSVSGLLFQSQTYALKDFVILHLDLMRVGLLDFFDFVGHVMEIFVLARQSPLKLRIFPKEFIVQEETMESPVKSTRKDKECGIDLKNEWTPLVSSL